MTRKSTGRNATTEAKEKNNLLVDDFNGAGEAH
jgi:hypothetical protein